MRDHEARAAHGQRVHRLLDQLLGACIDRGGGFVEDQDRRVLHHRSRDRQQLALALGKRRLVVEHGVVAVRQRHDVVVQADGLACGHDLLVGDVLLRIRDVFTHCSTEHPRVLQHHGELVVHVPTRYGLGVDAVDRNRATGNLVEAHQQVDHGGLAGAGRADDSHLLAGLHGRGEVVDDGLVRVVAEAHVAEFHVAAHRLRLAVRADAQQRLLAGFVGQFRLLKEAEDAFGCGRAALQVLERLRELGQRLREQADVHHERHDHAEFDLAVHGEHRADHAHHHVAEVADEVHDRHHQAGQELAFPAGHVQVFVVLLELLDGAFLAAVCLDHGVAGVHFLDVAVDVAERHLLAGEVLLRHLHDHAHDDQAEQRGADGAQRHGHVVVEHHDERAEEQRDRCDERADRLAERLSDRVDVVGDAAQHVAVADFVEIFQRQAIDFLADRLT